MRSSFWFLLIASLSASPLASSQADDSKIEYLLKLADEESNDLFSALQVEYIEKGTDQEDLNRANPPEVDNEWDGQNNMQGRRSSRKSIPLIGKPTSFLKPDKFTKKLSEMKNKFTKLSNKANAFGKKGWAEFKNKFEKGKNAGKKMMKSVLKDLYEEGKKEALEIMKAAMLEWIDEKLKQTFCQCFSSPNKPTRKCRCCINFPGLKRACLKVEAKIRTTSFDVSLKYEGSEFVKAFMLPEQVLEKRSVCSVKPIGDKQRKVCANLPYELHFMDVCIQPGDVELEENENGKMDFAGCFQISIGRLDMSWEVCVQFNQSNRELSFVSLI